MAKVLQLNLFLKKYKLLLVNSGLLYRYGSKLVIINKPKNVIQFFKKKTLKMHLTKIFQNKNLHSEEISNHVALLAKNKKVKRYS